MAGTCGRDLLLVATVVQPSCRAPIRHPVFPSIRRPVLMITHAICVDAGTYEYGGKQFSMQAHPEGPSHEKCSKTVLSALKHTADCGAPQVGGVRSFELQQRGECHGLNRGMRLED